MDLVIPQINPRARTFHVRYREQRKLDKAASNAQYTGVIPDILDGGWHIYLSGRIAGTVRSLTIEEAWAAAQILVDMAMRAQQTHSSVREPPELFN